jgi:hypothetical protein
MPFGVMRKRYINVKTNNKGLQMTLKRLGVLKHMSPGVIGIHSVKWYFYIYP